MKFKKHAPYRGFTLVELAIVITIIGLLIGGVLKGQELLENARMTSLGTQVKGYETAVTTFRDMYKAPPGDLRGAPDFITGCTVANNCLGGDGSGSIDGTNPTVWSIGYTTQETFQVWKHMALANLITGVTVSLAQPGSYTGGTAVPTTPFGGQVYMKNATGNLTHPNNAGNGIVLLVSMSRSGREAVASSSVGGLFTPLQAKKIDLKIDDGRAFSGDVYAVSGIWELGCGVASAGLNAADGYGINTTAKNCDLGITVTK